MSSALTVALQWDNLDGWWVASIAEAPGCLSQGRTIPEALGNIGDAYEAWRGVAEGLKAERGGSARPAGSNPAPALDVVGGGNPTGESPPGAPPPPAPSRLVDSLLDTAVEWDEVCRRQGVHDVCDFCIEAGLLRSAADEIERLEAANPSRSAVPS